MSRDIGIYSKKKQPVSIEEILKTLRKRGLNVDWTLVDPVKIKTHTEWGAGYFLNEGEENQHKRVDLSNFQIMEFMRIDIAEHLSQEQFRDHIRSSETKYTLSVTSQMDSAGKNLLINLAYILAKLSDGIIQDWDADRFYTADEYEQANSDFLKR